MIAIISHEQDLHASDVLARLRAAGQQVLLLDTARLPSAAALTTQLAAQGSFAVDWEEPGGPVPLHAVRAVWWRRPQPFQLPDALRLEQDRAFARGECAAALAGLWSCLDADWVNDPDRDEAASRKMWQLREASRAGLRIPRTCMTNDPRRARDFVSAQPTGAIYKSFTATEQTWRETRPVTDVELAMLDSVAVAPVIFQEYIPGGVDIRLTVVGRQAFAAEIRGGQAGFEFDFRLAADPTTLPHELPPDLLRRLHDLVAGMGLHYAAIDLRRDPSGDYVFLEVNPAGQWLFVERATGQPISQAVADLLAGLDLARSGPARPAPGAPSPRPGRRVGPRG